MADRSTKHLEERAVQRAREPKMHIIKAAPKKDTRLATDFALSYEDEFQSVYRQSRKVTILKPPINPLVLRELCTRNNILPQCIEVMEVNIDGTGYDIALIEGKTENQAEQDRLKQFFDEPFPGVSMVTLRRKMRNDRESIGWGTIEVIRNAAGEIILLRYLDAATIRLIELDDPIDKEITVTRDGKESTFTLQWRERRFVQKAGRTMRYFAEYGASRKVDKVTGEWLTGDGGDLASRGSEILYFPCTKDAKTAYGLPRWINNLPSVLGSRKAEKFNLEFFDADGLPPALIFVMGALLGPTVAAQLNHFLSSGAGAKQRAAVIEAVGSGGSLEGREPPVNVKVERFGCVDDATEVLTDAGWLPIKNWKGQSVATVKKGELVYDMPVQYHSYDFDGRLIHIEGNATEFCVTPNHRVWYEPTHRHGVLRFELASDTVNRSNVRVPVSAVLGREGETQINFSVAGRSHDADSFLDFLGMFIADGSTTLSEGNSARISISVKKQRKKDFINGFAAKVAESAGGKLSVYECDDGYTAFSLVAKELREWLREHVGAYAREKKIPAEFKRLNQIQSERLLLSLLQGDGHYNGEDGKHGWTFTTTSPRLADDVQTVCMHAGYRSVLSKVNDREEWCISITPKAFAHVAKSKCPAWEWVPYAGKVYCFTMKTGVFVTRRNGKVCITGNSERQSDSMFQKYDDNTSEHVRLSFRIAPIFLGKSADFNFATAMTMVLNTESQVFAPERILFDEVMNKTIMKALGAQNYEFKSKPLIMRNTDVQMKALELGKDSVAGDDWIKMLNDVTNLDLKFDQKTRDDSKPPPPGFGPDGKPLPVPAKPGQDNAVPNRPGQPSNGNPLDAGKAQKVEMLGLDIVQKSIEHYGAMDIVGLVDLWGEARQLIPSEHKFSAEEVRTIDLAVSKLNEGQREMFNQIVTVQHMQALHGDAEDMEDITGCCIDLLKRESV